MEWSEQLDFCFPQGLGNITEVQDIQIKVNWEQQHQKVCGLYVIKAKVKFDFLPVDASDGIFIEHIDLEDDTAYFEYGVPFEHATKDILVQQLTINSIQATADTNFRVEWDVAAQIEHAVPEVKQIVPEIEQTVAKIEHAVPEVEQAVAKIEHVVPEVEQTVAKIEHVVPEVEHAFPEIEQTVAKIEHAVPEVGHAVPRIEQTVAKIEHSVPEIEQTMEQLFNFKEQFVTQHIVLDKI